MTSPQIANSEEMMTEAENSLTPYIIAAILAVAPMAAEDEEPDYGAKWGVIAKGMLIPGYAMIQTAARGLRELVYGAVLNALIPLLLFRLRLFDVEGRYRGDVGELARESAEYAVDQAVTAMMNQAVTVGHPDSMDFYETTERGGTDRVLRTFAERTSRWITREALFRAQSEMAEALGYSHKRWITVGDERVRSEHRRLDGRAVPVGSVFRTQGGQLRYPGDVSAPIHLWINCRCSLEFLNR